MPQKVRHVLKIFKYKYTQRIYPTHKSFYPLLQYKQFMLEKCSTEVINDVSKATWKPKCNI